MTVVLIIHNLFFYLTVVLTFVVGTFIAWVFSLFARDKTRVFLTAARIWSNLLVALSGMRVKCSGLKNIPKKQGLILVSNHQGAADILLLLAKLPLFFRFVIKQELFKVPFFGWYLRKAGNLAIERGSAASAFSTLNQALELLAKGNSILIFPEGTRSADGKLGPFKRGSLVLALKSGAPVVPIAINGSFKAQKKGSLLFYPTTITLCVGKPLQINRKENPSKEDQERELERVREAIRALLEA